jgi:thiamine-phosphate pyrophosphorylase
MEQGVELVQIREPQLTTRQLAEFTRKVLSLPNPHDTKILVNDRADVAIACKAHGVHLRDGSPHPDTRLLPRLPMITRAAHTLAQLPQITGVDYILLAPIFAPLSKEATTPPLGLEALREAVKLTSVPILALGGITEANAHQCIEAGAAGIAGISYFASPNKACA